MTMYYYKLNLELTLIPTMVPYVVYLLEQITIDSDIWYVPLQLVNGVFSIYKRKSNQKQYIFMWQRTFFIYQCSCTLLPCLFDILHYSTFDQQTHCMTMYNHKEFTKINMCPSTGSN